MKNLQLTMNHWIWGRKLSSTSSIIFPWIVSSKLASPLVFRLERLVILLPKNGNWAFDEDLRFWDVGNPWKSPVQGWKCTILQEKQSTMIILAVLSLGSCMKLRCVIRPMDQPTWQLFFSMEKSWLNPPFRG